MSFCPWQESSCNVAFYFCRRSRVQEEDRFLSMPPKQCLRPQKHWPPPDNACMPRRRKGIVAEYSTWRRRTINKKPTKKTAPLSNAFRSQKQPATEVRTRKHHPIIGKTLPGTRQRLHYQTTQKYMYLQY